MWPGSLHQHGCAWRHQAAIALTTKNVFALYTFDGTGSAPICWHWDALDLQVLRREDLSLVKGACFQLCTQAIIQVQQCPA